MVNKLWPSRDGCCLDTQRWSSIQLAVNRSRISLILTTISNSHLAPILTTADTQILVSVFESFIVNTAITLSDGSILIHQCSAKEPRISCQMSILRFQFLCREIMTLYIVVRSTAGIAIYFDYVIRGGKSVIYYHHRSGRI